MAFAYIGDNIGRWFECLKSDDIACLEKGVVNMDRLTCQCCGAPLDPKTLICSYCGTAHKRTDDYSMPSVRIETFHQPVDTLRSVVVLEPELYSGNLQKASEYAMRVISNKLADNLTPFISYRSSESFGPNGPCMRIEGTLKAVRPINNFVHEGRDEW